MARRKTLPESVRAKYSLAERLSSLRAELYGERGGPELARQLGLPVRTWYNYESGVTVPAEVILRIIELTSVEPMWLLHGKGPKFRPPAAERRETVVGPGVSVGSLLRTALAHAGGGQGVAADADRLQGRAGRTPADEHADVVLLAVDDSAGGPITKTSGPRYVAARSEWLDAERECRCIRIEGDAMSPIVGRRGLRRLRQGGGRPGRPRRQDGRRLGRRPAGRPLVPVLRPLRRAPRREPGDRPRPRSSSTSTTRHREARFRRVLWINTPH